MVCKKYEKYFLKQQSVLFGKLKKNHLLCSRKIKGSLAEWLGTGLQNRLQQFESARNLEKSGLFRSDFLSTKHFHGLK